MWNIVKNAKARVGRIGGGDESVEAKLAQDNICFATTTLNLASLSAADRPGVPRTHGSTSSIAGGPSTGNCRTNNL